MIKQIQLRGISRIPSDRATQDGGLAESLNYHLEQSETAPTLPATDISSSIYGDLTKYPIIYVHKMLGVTNYIGQTGVSSGKYGFYAYGSNIGSGDHAMGGDVPSSETFKCATSVGNTLIIFTDANPYYFLYKDNKYTFLGSSIPLPVIEIACRPASTSTWSNNKVEVAEGTLRTASVTSQSNITYADVSRWNDAKVVGDECYDELMETMSNVWGAISQGVAEIRNAGAFCAPFFIRYALRLYDGSYIATSSPILMGAGKDVDWVSTWLLDTFVEGGSGGYTGRYIEVKLNNIFEVYVKGSYALNNWGDIVKSIDFFASTPIYAPAQEAGFESMASRSMPESTYLYNITLDLMSSTTRESTIKNEVLSKGQFYKIKSIDLKGSEMSDLTDGDLVITNSANISGDGLPLQETFPDDFRDAIQYIPTADAQNYNGRLMLIGADEMLARGDMFLNGEMADGDAQGTHTATKYQLRFKIVNPINGSVNHVLAHYHNGSTEMKPAIFSSSALHFGSETVSGGTATVPYAWISYPDTRCTEVEIAYWTSSGRFTRRVPLEKHPLLECAYAFFGYGESWQSGAWNQGTQVSTVDDSEQRTMSNENKLLLSEFENPFIFPAENIVTFGDRLIGAATVSVPLSEGQFGEYPLYAFTEGGIRVLVTTAEGTIAAANAHPNLSRHIALPGTILGLEQAVVFATKKGVMLLSGNQVSEISTVMNGRPDPLHPSVGSTETGSEGILYGSQWQSLLPAANSDGTLMWFMENAHPAYDHNGARLLFFNPTLAWQYEYRFQTQTWHKILSGVTGARILNSYPDCLLSYTDSSVPKVMNFSTVLNYEHIVSDINNPVLGIIATRPFDLGEPDVRKSINSIRIRGRYNRCDPVSLIPDVQYILLGSMDGLNWQRLTSLRGGSYKVFRMVIVTRLSPMERITWIDIDYDTRMTNKLR